MWLIPLYYACEETNIYLSNTCSSETLLQLHVLACIKPPSAVQDCVKRKCTSIHVIIKNWNIILSQVFVVTQVLYLLVTLHWRGAVLLVTSYKKLEMWVMMACHFHSGIGSCEPCGFKYIEIIRQLFHKIPNLLEIKSREGLVFIMYSHCAYS